MKHLIPLLIAKVNTAKVGLAVLAGLGGATALAVLPYRALVGDLGGSVPELPPGGPATPPGATETVGDEGVKIRVAQSQAKVVQGSADEIYLDITLDIPAPARMAPPRRASDLVLVLDRSGSMADDRKMEFARAAMLSFIGSLTDQDRIALITFDDSANVEFPLAVATAEARRVLAATIRRLEPGSSTNMGSGLEAGAAALAAAAADRQGRPTRIVLLSDGHANAGVASPEGLARIVKGISSSGTVVSTVGMGLDFNERILTGLADHGMGNYTYIETLTNLDRALAQDLADARAQFAAVSHLELELGDGVSVVDAAGYPVESAGGNLVKVPLGQLLEGGSRSVTVSLQAPTGVIGDRPLATVRLEYERAGKIHTVAAASRPFQVTVVSPDREAEAVASVDPSVLRKTWVSNNAGRMKKDFAEKVRDGDQGAARQVLREYRSRLGAASAKSGVDLSDKALDEELVQLEAMADDAFSGPAAEQVRKAKSLSKATWSSGVKAQRAAAPATAKE